MSLVRPCFRFFAGLSPQQKKLLCSTKSSTLQNLQVTISSAEKVVREYHDCALLSFIFALFPCAQTFFLLPGSLENQTCAVVWRCVHFFFTSRFVSCLCASLSLARVFCRCSDYTDTMKEISRQLDSAVEDLSFEVLVDHDRDIRDRRMFLPSLFSSF